MSKYKYILKKPKGAIARDILLGIAAAGVLAIAATSPFFVVNLLRALKQGKQYKRDHVRNTYNRLRKQGCIKMHKEGKQLYISLTEKGRWEAGLYQINHLKIKKQKQWNEKWHVVIFDIPHDQRVKREALRGFFKRLGFSKLQKSVWVYPYPCKDEIDLLRDFFGFTQQEIRLMVIENIGDDKILRKIFNL